MKVEGRPVTEAQRIHVGVSFETLKSRLLLHWNNGRKTQRESLEKMAFIYVEALKELRQIEGRLNVMTDAELTEFDQDSRQRLRPRKGSMFYVNQETDLDSVEREFISWIRRTLR